MTVTDASLSRHSHRSAIVALWTCLLLAGVLLLCRRMQGGFEQRPSFALFIIATVIVQIVCLASGLLILLTADHRVAASSQSDSPRSRSQRMRLPFTIAIAIVIPLVWAASLWPQNQALATGSLLALLVCSLTMLFVLNEAVRSPLSAEAVSRRGSGIANRAAAGNVSSTTTGTPLPPSEPGQQAPVLSDVPQRDTASEHGTIPASEDFGALHEADFGADIEELPEADDADVTQWLRRRNIGPGEEMIEGTVTVEFAAGCRQAVMHLAFQPPLCGSPQVECEVLDESEISLKVAERQTWGLRIDARRRGDTTEACRIPVGFCATAQAIAPAA